jgi:outer membrane lipoprotein SlyB
MSKTVRNAKWLAALALALASACGAAWAQSSVNYGRITAISLTTVGNSGAQAAGALVGGGIGLATGSGQSRSNRALRGIGGAVAGQQLTRIGTNTQAFEFTILLGGRQTITMVSDEAGLRVGDCVAVERGQFNNLRLVDDSRCAPGVTATPAAVAEADACTQAKQQLLAAETEEALNLAERRVRLLCAD